MADSDIKLTPMMQQYMDIKSNFEDAILFFRLGDFYEAFFDDARTISKTLQLVLTSRNGNDMAGIPHHALDGYLKKLVNAGFKVAICDQVEEPSQAKGIVRREVTRVVTPGTVVEDSILEYAENSFLAAVSGTNIFEIVILDISTGQSYAFQRDSWENVLDIILKHSIVQLILPEGKIWKERNRELKKINPLLYIENLPDWYFNETESVEHVKRIFKIGSIDFLELPRESTALFGAMLKYLEYQKMSAYEHLSRPVFVNPSEILFLDSVTIENLNLTSKGKENKSRSLLEIIDNTSTAMGSRKLREWILTPLRNRSRITDRQNHVEELLEKWELARELEEKLKEVYDLERIISRVSYSKAVAKDLVSLRRTLEAIPEILVRITELENFSDILYRLNPLEDLKSLLQSAIEEEPSGIVGEGKTVKFGFNGEFDEYLELLSGSSEKLRNLEEYERERTGIQKLKIGKNNVYGYYIEVSKASTSKVPADYVRKQTLVSSERYISDSLKPIEEKMNHANEMIERLEKAIFNEILKTVISYVAPLKEISDALSTLDVFLSMSKCARKYGYVRPTFSQSGKFEITEGRHPVVERFEDSFIPNDLSLSDDSYFIILTGPNMSGKSTYLRQVALISILAQTGSFVPAKSVHMPLLDRIFTRIGARDDLASGKSTFLVEMSETATILNNATADSLVILDEVGRGTSTYDGISIAWVVSEYIFNNIGAYCIFATHYNELTELSTLYGGMKNMMVKVVEQEGEVVFLHKVVPGAADRSYGIEVARIAGLPPEVIERSYKILDTITDKNKIDGKIRVIGQKEITGIKKNPSRKSKQCRHQMSFFD